MDSNQDESENGQDVDLKTLKTSFAKIYSSSDLVERELKLIQATKQYKKLLEPEDYRCLFKAYCQQHFLKRFLTKIGQIFGIVSASTILLGVTTFVWEASERQQKLQAEAWEVLISNKNNRVSGGRKEALEYLNRPSFILTKLLKKGDNRIVLSGLEAPDALLSQVKLRGAKLQGSNFKGANLYQADFSQANLYTTDFTQADLHEANFHKAILWKANLREAELSKTDIRGANLKKVNLRGAFLKGANLYGADLKGAVFDKETTFPTEEFDAVKAGAHLIDSGVNLHKTDLREVNLQEANLQNANLREADLEGADLKEADLKGADIEGANLWKTKNLAIKQVKSAKNWEKLFIMTISAKN